MQYTMNIAEFVERVNQILAKPDPKVPEGYCPTKFYELNQQYRYGVLITAEMVFGAHNLPWEFHHLPSEYETIDSGCGPARMLRHGYDYTRREYIV